LGGVGSGQYWRMGKKTTLDDCTNVLSIQDMVNKGVIPAQGYSQGSWHWLDSYTGERCSSLDFEVNTTNPHFATMRLKYTIKNMGERVNYLIDLERTRPHFGGWRWWFICPYKGKRVTKLYLPYGATKYASRHAYGLAYGSQSEAWHDRMMRKSWKLKNKLGGEEWYCKPKGMHEKTFDRLFQQVLGMEDRLEDILIDKVKSIMQIK